MSDTLEQMQATRDCDMVMADFASQSASMFTLGQVRWAILEIERLRARLEAAEGVIDGLLTECEDFPSERLRIMAARAYVAKWGDK